MSDWGHMMNWDYGNWGWGAMMFGGIGMLLFWGLVIGLGALAVRGLAGGGNPTQPPGDAGTRGGQTPLEIAQARYARGDISRQEYETIRQDLQHA